MSSNALLQVGLYFAVLLLLARPLGLWMARIYEGDIPVYLRFLRPIEKLLLGVSGVREDEGMNWKTYAFAVLAFNALGFLAVYALQRAQGFLPLNPAGQVAVSPDSSFNTGVSFITNTNWQGYGGESTMSYLTQMAALTVQNFVSAATGMAVLIALVRGLRNRLPQGEENDQKTHRSLGNFWVDLTRSTLYILLPLSVVFALFLVSQGVVQTTKPYAQATLVQPAVGADKKPLTSQTIAVGPAASQIAIKQLGTNGGGFFNVNSAHPFENPNPLTNFAEMLAILLIPAALCLTFGKMVGDERQGWAILAAMTAILLALTLPPLALESGGNPILSHLHVAQPLGNMEGKETRFGVTNSVLWATVTTAASNGSVNSMHDSFTPLAGLFPMLLIQLGEVVFGGVGSGLYGMLIFAIISVFVAGLMVGRTPEYLGKKIESYEMKMSSLIILIPCSIVLIGTAIAVSTAGGQAGPLNKGAHGFSEILYALSSASGNNGSAFAGISANTPFYNTLLGIAMLISRYWLIIPTLAIGGSMARKKTIPVGPGTLPTHNALFVGLLIGVVLLVGALTFIPALALGPIVEQLQLAGK